MKDSDALTIFFGTENGERTRECGVNRGKNICGSRLIRSWDMGDHDDYEKMRN